MNKRPDLSRVPEQPQQYIKIVVGDDLAVLLKDRIQTTATFLRNIPEEQWAFRYAPGKWSVKEMIQHVIDAERIFCYRALCLARGETASLPGFDENAYAAASVADRRTKESLLVELNTVQQATALLFESFDDEQLEREGLANGNLIYVRAIAFIIIGHLIHHIHILHERYL